MKILFIGNSITEGLIGVDFVKLFKFENPAWIIKNAGTGGDTLTNVSQRVLNELSCDSNFDFIVFEAGYNDIILPYFNNRGILFQFAFKYLTSKGRSPITNGSEFKLEYKKIVEQIKDITNAKIILTTIGCINEKVDTKLNTRRLEFNQIIREIANDSNCLLADVANQFELALNHRNQTDYLLKSFWNSVYFDRKICKTKNGADKLSMKRNLQLTIDGVHLNSKGALIFKTIIEKQIKRT